MNFYVNREIQENIERRVIFEQRLSPDLHEILLNICNKAPIIQTLLRSLDIQTTLL